MNIFIYFILTPLNIKFCHHSLQARADSCQFGHECADCRRVARFKVGEREEKYYLLNIIRVKVGQNIFRARDKRVEAAEWRHVIRSYFSEIDLFPVADNVASFK